MASINNNLEKLNLNLENVFDNAKELEEFRKIWSFFLKEMSSSNLNPVPKERQLENQMNEE